MNRYLVALVAAFCAAASLQTSAAAFTPQVSSATRALQWIQQTQLKADGSVAGDPTRTEETVWGLAANHQPYVSFVKTGSTKNPLDYLAANLTAEESSAGNIAQLILAVTAAGQDPTNFGPAGAKRNLLNDLEADYDTATGEYGTDKVFNHIMALLALRSANQTPPTGAITFLKKQQKSDGGWSFDNADAYGTDTNTTALALVALAATSSLQPCPVSSALRYLKAAQQPGGGFPYQAAYPPSDPDSDGIVIEGLLAVGQHPTGSAWTKPGGKNPLKDLLSFQGTDGSFSFPGVGPDNLLATTQPLVALASSHLPLSATGTSFEAQSIGNCEVAASASPSATSGPTPRPVPLLAQTGEPPVFPLGLLLLAFGIGVLLWNPRRQPR
jgi:hypothetical protein